MTLTVIEVSGGLTDDIYVEVKGAYQTADQSVLASRIEQEDEGFGDDLDDVSLQGIISEFNNTGDFKIDGLPIDASGATKLSPANVLSLLEGGVEIEVEGNIVGGKLIADEVELREGDTELQHFRQCCRTSPNRFRGRVIGVNCRDQSSELSGLISTGKPCSKTRMIPTGRRQWRISRSINWG